jgi:hypothetical protein
MEEWKKAVAQLEDLKKKSMSFQKAAAGTWRILELMGAQTRQLRTRQLLPFLRAIT